MIAPSALLCHYYVMVLFRIGLSIFWFSLVAVLFPAIDIRPLSTGQRREAQVSSRNSNAFARLLVYLIPILCSLFVLWLVSALETKEYSGFGYWLHHFLTDWLPLLFVPSIYAAVSAGHSRMRSISLKEMLRVYWILLMFMLIYPVLFHEGIWTAMELFVDPILMGSALLVPPMMMFVRYLSVGRIARHTFWLLLLAVGAAAAGVQSLFLLNRWLLGILTLLLFVALTVGCVFFLSKVGRRVSTGPAADEERRSIWSGVLTA